MSKFSRAAIFISVVVFLSHDFELACFRSDRHNFSLSDLCEIWHVCRDWWVIQGQGHKTLKVEILQYSKMKHEKLTVSLSQG